MYGAKIGYTELQIVNMPYPLLKLRGYTPCGFRFQTAIVNAHRMQYRTLRAEWRQMSKTQKTVKNPRAVYLEYMLHHGDDDYVPGKYLD